LSVLNSLFRPLQVSVRNGGITLRTGYNPAAMRDRLRRQASTRSKGEDKRKKNYSHINIIAKIQGIWKGKIR
jgi:hypothetical protein